MVGSKAQARVDLRVTLVFSQPMIVCFICDERAHSITMGITRSTRVLIPSAIASFTEKQLAGVLPKIRSYEATRRECQRDILCQNGFIP